MVESSARSVWPRLFFPTAAHHRRPELRWMPWRWASLGRLDVSL